MRVAVLGIAVVACGSPSKSPPDVPVNAPWQTATTTFDQSLIGVWASGSDVFVVGYDAGSFHSTDGVTYTEVPLNAGTAHGGRIWGRSPGDVFATGFSGKMVHSADRGASWQAVTTGATRALYGMWGTGTEIYVVGDDGAYHTADGTTWQMQTVPVSGYTLAVWGSGPSDVYAVGDGGIAHTDGSGTWTMQANGLTALQMTGIWGSGASDIYAVGGSGILHSDGSGTWTAQTSCGGPMYSVWGASASDVWTVGPAGVICHSAGDGTWTAVDSGTTLDLYAIYGTASAIYAVGGTTPSVGIALRRP
ncbi:MAG: WD40/YVTN/BNR-like repeat-containing protein [Acidobacteriota bacterium]